MRPEKGCSGDVYFGILAKCVCRHREINSTITLKSLLWIELTLCLRYSILPHLPRSHFASRPVARDGVTYNIDKIRAIPFTMVLAQVGVFC